MTWTQGMLDSEEIFPSKVGEYKIGKEKSMSVKKVLTLDSRLYSNETGVPFPDNFQVTVKSILRRLFRVYAHIYNHHFAQICALSLEGKDFVRCFDFCSLSNHQSRPFLFLSLSLHAAHLNTSYRHFLLFINEFNLVDTKELAPLAELNEAILDEGAN